MKFEGEHLWIGQAGHFLVILAFVAALLSTISYFIASRNKTGIDTASWMRQARILFIVQAASIFLIFVALIFICSQHWFEYMYAYKHSSKELEFKYLLACIWEGQEGSFLLWSIWHCVLGFIFIWRRKSSFSLGWEAPVMTVVSLAQFFLMAMLLGIYVFDAHLGSSPFTLTRQEINAPIFAQANYLSLINDGVGLNILLRNYWMVIHPPILFLGFASAIIPFAYAYAGLQQKRFGDWIKPALPWALACAAILGTGIMMGGKWAYESLSFGGYWAWDPVENASLVPWLILIAGLHCMAIYRATGHSLRACYFFIFLAFSFVLYSTFLTRTGVLGDTSVHSFTEAGKAINVMILTFVGAFVLPALYLLFKNYKKIPAIHKEEETNSREFWMFIGSIVFFLTAIFIIAKTSVPVYNKITGGNIAPPADVEFSYNKVVVLIAFIVGILTGVTQYFRYKTTPKGLVLRNLALPLFISAALTLLLAFVYPFTFQKHGLGFLIAIYCAGFATIFAAVANAFYFVKASKSVLLKAGGSVAHFGFAVLIFGMLVSSSNKETISSSRVNGITLPASIDPMTKQQDDPQENLTLIRDVPARMGDYEVTYQSDSAGLETGRKFYSLLFEKKQPGATTARETFFIQPDVYMMKDNNMSSNPDTKNYLTKDVFTYISYALNDKSTNKDTAAFTLKELHKGDTTYYSNGMIVLKDIVKNPTTDKYKTGPGTMALMADLSVITKNGKVFSASPIIEVNGNDVNFVDDTLFAQSLYTRFSGIGTDNKIKIGFKEAQGLIDFVTVKTYVFPYINLVWLGLIIMSTGIVISMLYRGNFSKMQKWIILGFAFAGLVYMFLLANA